MHTPNLPAVSLARGTQLLPWPRRTQEDIVIGIPIAAHQESWDTIENTLDQLRNQSANPRSFRVFLHLNSPDNEFDGDLFNDTRDRLLRYASHNPEFRMSISEQSYSSGTYIGEIRRDLWSNVCAWAHTKGRHAQLPPALVGITTDIDSPYISPNLVRSYRECFAAHPDYSFGYGELHYSEIAHMTSGEMDDLPYQMIVGCMLELINAAEVLNKMKRPSKVFLVEANTGFRLRSYERVGGIDPTCKVSEIIDLSDRIVELDVQRNKKRAAMIHVGDAEIYTDSRRLISAAAKGVPMTQCWDLDRHDFTQHDALRSTAHVKHLVRGAALKIVEDLDEVVGKYLSEYDFAAFLTTTRDTPLGERRYTTLHNIFEQSFANYVRAMSQIVESYCRILDTDELEPRVTGETVVKEALHRIEELQAAFLSRVEGCEPPTNRRDVPMLQRILDPVPGRH
jgi:hypothetical protein